MLRKPVEEMSLAQLRATEATLVLWISGEADQPKRAMLERQLELVRAACKSRKRR